MQVDHPAPGTMEAARRFGRDWLRASAWPLWLEHGVDWRRGGFCENLDPTTLQSPAPFRRLRVAARQVHVFAVAAGAGIARAGEAMELGLRFMERHARGADGGYARQFDLGGAVTDPRRDLYDHAFVLLALSSAAAVLPAAPLRARALALLAYLDTRLAHPAGGYAEGDPASLPRRQNPHMHLLEAFLAAHEAFGEAVFLQRAEAMASLFLHRLQDPATGCLREYFDDALAPQTEDGRYAIEPGHHCEWVWLLDCFARRMPDFAAASRQAAAGLLAIVDRAGVNPALGTLYDELWQDGTVKSDQSRLWPQTERVKAELLRADGSTGAQLAAYRGVFRYFEGVPKGLWHERLLADGTAPNEAVPASSLYHLTSCLTFEVG